MGTDQEAMVARLGCRWLSCANGGSRSERPTVGGDCSETGSRSRRENLQLRRCVLERHQQPLNGPFPNQLVKESTGDA